MREKKQLLIATTNEGKYREVLHVLQDLPFAFLSLGDLPTMPPEPEETATTLFENAMLKARAYGMSTGMLSLSDDAGLFIDALGGFPGVKSARVAKDADARNQLILDRMKGITDRRASFRAAVCLYDPERDMVFCAAGETRGEILDAPSRGAHGFGYDPLFFSTDVGKPFTALTLQEKNAISHRGKALFQMKYTLQNQYGGRHLVVPCAIILQDGKVLMAKRNDPHRPEFHGKWEFPGGRMDIGETLEENLVREVWEEVGYRVAVLKRLPQIWIEFQSGDSWAYQVYLIPYACRILEGGGTGSDAEVLETRWFEPEAVLNEELIGANKKMYEAILPELKILNPKP